MSGMYGCRQISTANDTRMSEYRSKSSRCTSSGRSWSGNLSQVGDRLLGARKDGVVERLHLVHGAGQALRIALGLGGQAPVLGEGLEVGELGGQKGIGHRGHTSACLRR